MKSLIISLFLLLSFSFSAFATDDHCFTEDESYSFSFGPLVTPYGMRTYVHGAENFHVFVKPFCAPTDDIAYAMVSYVSSAYLHAKFPNQEVGESMKGTISVCMGNTCFQDKAVTCVGSFVEEYLRRCQ